VKSYSACVIQWTDSTVDLGVYGFVMGAVTFFVREVVEWNLVAGIGSILTMGMEILACVSGRGINGNPDSRPLLCPSSPYYSYTFAPVGAKRTDTSPLKAPITAINHLIILFLSL
jgi:hypothetical protein